jgi:hypothetical protein
MKIVNLIALLFLVSCGFGLEDNNVQNQEVNRQYQRLDKLGELIKGVYEGDLQHVDGEVYSIELRLYYIDEIAGKDENGDIYTLPRLKGQLRYLNFVYPHEEREFEVRFDETGSFQMIYSGDKDRGTSESINGLWQNAAIDAQWNENGKIGRLLVKRVSTEVPKIQERERRQRLANQYQGIIGLYEGELYTFRNPEIKYGDLNIIVDYDITIGASGLVAQFEVPNNVVFQEFRRVPLQWDPRTNILDFDYSVGKARITGSGTLSKNGLHLDKIRVVAEPMIYKPIRFKRELD